TPAGKPKLLVAHSMGGAIALLTLSRSPGVVDAAVLSAPMLALPVPSLARPIMRIYAHVAAKLGFGGYFIPGAGPWHPRADLCPGNSMTSNDPERCMLQQEWFEFEPQLRVDGPTYGWIDAAFKVTAKLHDPELLRRVMTPVLIGSAQKERFVRP